VFDPSAPPPSAVEANDDAVTEVRRSRAEPVPGAGPVSRSAKPPSAGTLPSAAKVPSAVPDILAPGLRAVFCGINPGRRSAAAGHHFANPRNDFWRLLHEASLTPRRLDPSDQQELLRYGFGLTNAAYRTTAGSGELRRADFEGSADRLAHLAAELRPEAIAFVGKEAFRGVFGERPALGLQPRRLHTARLFVLPSTSPANAAVPYAERLRWFEELARLVRGRFPDPSFEGDRGQERSGTGPASPRGDPEQRGRFKNPAA
jgi:TDG/mug DNA glycosylase family protein